MAVVTATQTLDPSARHEDDSQTQRRDFLSICYPQQSLSLISVLLIFSTGFVTSSGLRVASAPPTPHPGLQPQKQNKQEERHPICTHTPVTQAALFISPCDGVCACVRAQAVATLHRGLHFTNLLNNSISENAVTWKTLPQNEPGYDSQKRYILRKTNLFLQVNVFIKNNTNPKPY